MTAHYAELICRSHYSFLRGASHPKELVQQAIELGLTALAITDRDGVYGMPKAYRAIQTSEPKTSLKLIVGAELSFEDQARLHLISLDRKGYGLLCRLLTASHEGKEKGKAALDWKRFIQLMQSSASKKLVAIQLPEEKRSIEYEQLKEVFEDRFYLGLYRVLDGRDSIRTRKVKSLSQKYQLPIVATNDVHFHIRERKPLQDTLTAIRENQSLNDVGFQIFQNSERYLKSADEMTKLFQALPEAIENTIRISDQCHFCPSELRYYYPSEWIPAGETSQSYLERLTWEGAKKRYPDGIPEDVTQQLFKEFKLISEMKFADYFLTIWEIVEFARKKEILCQGRGSAANSAVCYCLGITAVDPVRMNLLFERFISAERGEPPDIDVDFEHERREEVIQHIYEKYGRHRAGMVSAIITYRSRSSLRDLTKALGEFVRKEEFAQRMEEIRGFPRHLSIHSGGFTLSAEPIIETVPIEPARMDGRTIVQWDKEDLDYIGLLKVDILALGMLSAIRKTLDYVQPRRPGLSLATLPAEDPSTYQMIQKGQTVGVFQIESRAQMSMLRRLLPRTFYDLVIQVAIVRPGPIQGQMVHPYLRRRRGQEDSRSPDPRLEPILGRTLGVPLFQEQVMKVAMVIADFSPGEADELRRAIGAWRSSGSIEKLGLRLKKGLLANGLPEEFVERIFKQIQGFAEYGFPESHAASFALLAYASSYLKAHYPSEFTCGLLNSQPMGFYSSHTLVEEAKRQGVIVLPVDPNESDWDCTCDAQSRLRIGLRVVQGLRQDQAKLLIQERRKERFKGLADFLSRVHLSRGVLNRLAMGDAFQAFGLSRRQALWEILSGDILKAKDQQLSLFSGVESLFSGVNQFRPLSAYESIQSDYESYRLSVQGHPLWGLRQDPVLKKRLPPSTTRTLKEAVAGRRIRLAGLVIVRQRPMTAKGTVFATLEDEFGFGDLIFHEQVYEKYEEVLDQSPFVIVVGRVQRDGEMVNLIVQTVESLFSDEVELQDIATKSRDFH
ncbi:MAG: PHP domain-containing protein [Bdellovibrio sp.]|nr:PHP domain-containing protein [Bdellovibrio sp.]